MFIVLRTSWEFMSGETRQKVNVPEGRYEVDRIPHPRKTSDCFWLVLRGTKIGVSEGYLRDFCSPDYGELEVVIED